MDIKAKIDEVVAKVQSDPAIMEKFKANPVQAVEGILGVDLPDDIINNIIDGVKTKISVDKISGALGGLFGGSK
jgi:hypothetical protein